MFKHKNAVVGFVMLGLIVLVSIVGAMLVEFDPYTLNAADNRMEPGQNGHWFGTDRHGYDVAAQVFTGTRLTLLTAVAAVAVALGIGLPLGAFSGYIGGRVDAFLSMLMNTMLSFPSLLTAICIVSMFEEKSLTNLLIAVSLVEIPRIARQARAAYMVEKEKDYLLSAKALGAPVQRQIFKTLLPNCLAPILVVATMGMGGAVLEIAGLSYIGLGAPPGTPEWGIMIADAKEEFRFLPWTIIVPGTAVAMAVLAFNLIGDGLQDHLNVRLKK